ncbi:hypothetical protein GCM10023322_02820 [Rugosimonospora acidiphila]|uniref:Uncharacterized protein n=1 Tax=Rugosimonospora acidiphila TaxID=556531 RepID=A0ABP9RH38_9ACTN
MDLLDRTYPSARDLLDRVDATLLAGGVPPGHPILALLRRLGALPGDVAAHLAEVAPGPLIAAGDPLGRQADGYEAAQASVPMPAAWRGPAAEGYAAQWSTLSGYLAGDPASMAGRLRATASYLDDLVAWLVRGRRALAGTLAECLGSAEAATLRASARSAVGGVVGGALSGGALAGGAVSGGPAGGGFAPAGTSRDAVTAAADLGAHVLGTAAEILHDGQRVVDAWVGRLDALPYPSSPTVAIGTGGHLELG